MRRLIGAALTKPCASLNRGGANIARVYRLFGPVHNAYLDRPTTLIRTRPQRPRPFLSKYLDDIADQVGQLSVDLDLVLVVLDGTWILDPDNTLYEQNEYNTNNSVIWME